MPQIKRWIYHIMLSPFLQCICTGIILFQNRPLVFPMLFDSADIRAGYSHLICNFTLSYWLLVIQAIAHFDNFTFPFSQYFGYHLIKSLTVSLQLDYVKNILFLTLYHIHKINLISFFICSNRFI